MSGSAPSKCPADIIREIKTGNNTREKLYCVLAASYGRRTISGHIKRLRDAGIVECVSFDGNLNRVFYRLKKMGEKS